MERNMQEWRCREELLLMEAPVVTLTGQYQMRIENYRFLRSLRENAIQVQGKRCRLTIAGECLMVDYYTGEAMKISGRICSLHYQEV